MLRIIGTTKQPTSAPVVRKAQNPFSIWFCAATQISRNVAMLSNSYYGRHWINFAHPSPSWIAGSKALKPTH